MVQLLFNTTICFYEGRNSVPKDVSADILLSEVIEFTKVARKVKKVKFVIFERDKDVFEVCEKCVIVFDLFPTLYSKYL